MFVSFVEWKDAEAALVAINMQTTMKASFATNKPVAYSDQLFIMDTSKLDEFEKNRMIHCVNTFFFCENMFFNYFLKLI